MDSRTFQHHNEDETEFASVGRMGGDHGSPTWEAIKPVQQHR